MSRNPLRVSEASISPERSTAMGGRAGLVPKVPSRSPEDPGRGFAAVLRWADPNK